MKVNSSSANRHPWRAKGYFVLHEWADNQREWPLTSQDASLPLYHCYIVRQEGSGYGMIRSIAVCDDEKMMQKQLSHYLEQYFADKAHFPYIGYYYSGEEVLAHMAQDTDVLLLDISMSGISGMETASALREKGCKTKIVFITSMEQYALHGYRVHAFAYLVKPIAYTDLAQVLGEIDAQMKENNVSMFAVDTAEGTQMLDLKELVYAEVYQHETCFVTQQDRVTAVMQLSQVEERLQSYGFFRCHRSYLVNLCKIRRIGPIDLTMSNGDAIPLSKHRRKAFIDAYSRWMEVVK